MVVTSGMLAPPHVQNESTPTLLGACVEGEQSKSPIFPWQRWYRCKKWAYRKYKEYQARYRKAKRMAQLARVAKVGMMSMATVVDAVIQSQIRCKLGALPVLYALLEILEVRKSINRHCKTNQTNRLNRLPTTDLLSWLDPSEINCKKTDKRSLTPYSVLQLRNLG